MEYWSSAEQGHLVKPPKSDQHSALQLAQALSYPPKSRGLALVALLFR
jgi:hypothetical protein